MNPVVSSIDIGDACFCQGDYYRALEHYFPVLRTLEREPDANPFVTVITVLVLHTTSWIGVPMRFFTTIKHSI